MADRAPETRNEALELGEVIPRRDLFEQAVTLGFEKMDLEQELSGKMDQGFDAENPVIKDLEVQIGLVDTQINSLATQWAEGKVPDLVNDPTRRAERVATRKEHFLKRIERKMRRNERKFDRYEETDEGYERALDRREGRKNRREARRDVRQEAREARREIGGREGRQAAREIRRDGRQAIREDRRQDHLERKRDRIDDQRDEDTVAYTNGQNGDPGMPNNSEAPTYKYRGDQNANSVGRDADFYEEGVEAVSASRDYSEKDIALLFIEQDLNPSALLEAGPNLNRAIDLAYSSAPEDAEEIKEILANGSPEEKAEIMKELQAKHSELKDPYRILQHGDIARRQVEQATMQSTLGGKISTLASEVGRNPEAMVALVGVGVGLWLLKDKIFPKETGGIKTALGTIALAAGGIYTFDFAWKKLDKEHRGLFDRLGFKPADIFSPDVLDKYRNDFFPSLPERDRDSVDDMIKIFDVPMERVNDSFFTALENQVTEVDTSSFTGQTVSGEAPLTGSVERTMDGTDMYRGFAWFYEKCAEKAMAQNPSLKPKDREAKLRLGLAYSKEHFAGKSFKEAVYLLTLDSQIHHEGTRGESAVAKGKNLPPVEYFDRDLRLPTEPKLLGLAERAPQFGGVLLGLPNGDILVKGYPYQYRFSDQGQHVFTSRLDGHVYRIPDHLQPGDLVQSMEALVQASQQAVQEKFDASFRGSLGVKLSYRPSGEWEIVPGIPRLEHQGVSVGDEKISAFLFADSEGFELSYNQAKKGQSFSTLEEVQKAYDKETAFPALVNRDAGHLLVGLPYKVMDVQDDATAKTTTVTIEYGHGHRGSMVYKDGSVESISLAEDAELTRQWEQASLALTVSCYMNSDLLMTGIEATAENFWQRLKSAVTFDDLEYKQASQTADLRDKELTTRTKLLQKELVDQVFSKGYAREKFDVEVKRVLGQYETDCLAILEKEVDLVLDSAGVELKKDEAEKAIRDALAPVDDASWQTDQVQEDLRRELESKWIQKTMSEIDALVALGAPIKESQIDAIIERNRSAASVEASKHRGKTGEESRELLWDAKLVANEALWKPHAQRVEAYLNTRFAWKPDQRKEVMDLYMQRIDGGRMGSVAMPGGRNSTDEYTTYFLSSVYAIMGGKETGWDGMTQLVMEDFDAHRAQLQKIRSYADWTKVPELRANPPGLEDSNEALRESLKASFVDWFDKNMELSTWTGLEGQWPNSFRAYTMQRLDRIVMDSSRTSLEVDGDVKRFKQFVATEYHLYKICVDGGYHGWTDPEEVRDHVLDPKFKAIWKDPHKDYKDYASAIDPEFGRLVKGEEYHLLDKALYTVLHKIGWSSVVAFPLAGLALFA